MRRLVLIRHGETVDNARRVTQGWRDSELSPLGARQVRQLATRLSSLGVSAIYSSPLPRAVTTATAIGRITGHEVVQHDGLREMNCGTWEGLSFDSLGEDDQEYFQRWLEDPEVSCPEGESYSEVLTRMRAAITDVVSQHEAEEDTIVVVSHGTAIRVTATWLLDLPLTSSRRLIQDNTAINIFEWRTSRWLLKCWNDTTHCAKEE